MRKGVELGGKERWKVPRLSYNVAENKEHTKAAKGSIDEKYSASEGKKQRSGDGGLAFVEKDNVGVGCS